MSKFSVETQMDINALTVDTITVRPDSSEPLNDDAGQSAGLMGKTQYLPSPIKSGTRAKSTRAQLPLTTPCEELVLEEFRDLFTISE